MKLQTFLLSILLSMSMHLHAEYKPAISMGETKETWEVHADASAIQTLESSIKIETQRGIDIHGQRTVSYNSKLENLEVIDAYTLQEDGTKIKVPKDAIRTTGDSVSDGAPMFSETKHKVIVYPNVKIGSQLYFKIRSVQHTPEFKGHFFYSQYFSPHYKYEKQEFNFIVSDKLPFQVDSKSLDGGLISQKNHQKHYQYTYSQDSAKTAEPFEVDSDDFSPYLIASTFKDYIEFGKAYEKGAASKIKVTPEIQKLADELTQDKSTKREQVAALYHWVSKNIRYVAIYLGHGGVVPHDTETILKNHYGDCKDHTIILAALLKAKGIESDSALISLGDNYKLPKLAVMSPLNHVINYIPSLDMYLDSTAQFAPFGTLPFEDMDKPVILTGLNKIGHTPLPNPKDHTITTKVKIDIEKDGRIYGRSHSSLNGYFNSIYRARASDEQGVTDSERIRRRLTSYGETGDGEITTSDPTDLGKPFTEDAVFQIDAQSNFPGPGAMTIPVGVTLTSIKGLGKDKPLQKESYPAICYSKRMIETYTLTFPKNVRITKVPPNVVYKKGSIYYKASYERDGDKVYAFRAFSSDHPGSVCEAGFNDVKKEFFKVVQRDLRSQIFYD